MGELILFRPHGSRRREPQAELPGDARIVFFTGVRYERMAEPPSQNLETGAGPSPNEKLGKSGRGRKRRRG